LTLGKIIKIVATRCQILRLKCTKFDFGWGSLQRSPRPDPLAGLKGHTSKGRRRDVKRRGGWMGREGTGRGGGA